MKKFMPKNEEQKSESVEETAGSSDELIQKDPSTNDGGGESEKEEQSKQEIDLDKYVPKDQYEELEKKLGEQGKELGENREFIKSIEPLLNNLDGKSEIIQLILDGKLDTELAQAISDGKVKVEEATQVAEAHEEVKKDLGDKKYDSAKPAEIEKLVTAKLEEVRKEVKADISKHAVEVNQREERKDFERSVDEFVKNTPDFAEYADEINAYLEENPDEYKIDKAYEVVTGRHAKDKLAKMNESSAAEAQKELASNAGGGPSQGSQFVADEEAVDSLIAGKSNPNY